MHAKPRTTAKIAGALLGAAALSFSTAGIANAGQADAGQANAAQASAEQTRATTFAHGTVTANGGLISHRAPSTHAYSTYTFAEGSQIAINCATRGTRVSDNPRWYLIAAEGDAHWVSARYVRIDEGKPQHCGLDVSIPATTTESTGAYEGPTKSDLYLESINKGVGTEVMCYTDSGRGPTRHRWMVTLDAQWIPSGSLKPAKTVPFCEQM